MGEKGLTALTDLRAAEVSLVDRGANRKKRFPIYKQEKTMDVEIMKVLKEVLETETETEAEAKLEEICKAEKVSKKGVDAIRGALRILNAFKEELPKDVMKKLSALAGFPFAQGDGKDDDEPAPADKSRKAPVAKSDELPPEVKAIMEPILKAQADQITALQERVTKSDEALAKERDDRAMAGWVEKCEKELAFYPGKSSADLGKMLHTLSKQDPGMAEEQFEAMKKASVAIEKSALLTDKGMKPAGSRSAAAAGSAWDAIEKLADGLVQKSEGGLMPRGKAIQLVLKSAEGKKLYEQYLAEHPAQITP